MSIVTTDLTPSILRDFSAEPSDNPFSVSVMSRMSLTRASISRESRPRAALTRRDTGARDVRDTEACDVRDGFCACPV